MSEQEGAVRLPGIVDKMVAETDGEEASVRNLLGASSTRSYGPLLLIPSLILLTPLGGLPGLPAVAAVLTILVSGQLISGRQHPWLPDWMLNLSFRRQRLLDSEGRLKRWLRALGKVFKPRLENLMNPLVEKVVAGACILLALAFLPLGFIPLAVAAPAAAICVLALGITTRDGLLTAVGLAISLILLIGSAYWLLA